MSIDFIRSLNIFNLIKIIMGVILNKNKRKLAFDDEDLLVQEESPVIINQPNN